MEGFTQRYRQSGSPLAHVEGAQRTPDFDDWRLWLHPELAVQEGLQRQGTKYSRDVHDLQGVALLCCPEDHQCTNECVVQKYLCPKCRLPVCRDCQISLQRNAIVPLGLCNDNWYGYVDRWLYEQESK